MHESGYTDAHSCWQALLIDALPGSIHAVFDAGVPLEVHQPTVEAMKAHYEPQGKEVNESRLRMATLPAGCEVCLRGMTFL